MNVQILRSGGIRTARFEKALSSDQVRWLQRTGRPGAISQEVEDYLLDLVAATRSDAGLIRGGLNTWRRSTVSSRPGHGFGRVAAMIPDDVRELAVPVLAHRVQARAEGRRLGEGGGLVIREILRSMRPPG